MQLPDLKVMNFDIIKQWIIYFVFELHNMQRKIDDIQIKGNLA